MGTRDALRSSPCPIAVYIADTSVTVLKRWRQGEVWYESHRSHVYQRLTDHGLSHPTVALIVFVFVGLCGTFGYLITTDRISQAGGGLVILLIVTVYVSLPPLVRKLIVRRGGEMTVSDP